MTTAHAHGSTARALAAGLLVLAAGHPSVPGASEKDVGAADSLTFARDVAPILYRHCAACHRPNGSAPFSLLTYREVRDRAALIADAVESRRMPPWLPEPGYGEFAGERRLSEREIGLIRRWADEGAREGDPAALPPAPEWIEGWQLGEPDVVLALPRFTVPAGGGELFRNLVVPAPLGETKYVRAVELRPGNARVVHHARLMVDTTDTSRRADEADHGPGFDGMELGSSAASPDGFFIGWTPGRLASRGPDDMAWRLAPGTDLVLQLHLRPGAAPATVAPIIGLHFSDRPPRRIPTLLLLGSEVIDIPPGERAYVVSDSYELPVDAEILGVYPHAHYLATTMEAFATLPNGATRRLLRIPAWDFNWQDEYRYAAAVRLPRGTVLTMRYRYDNSAENPRNPHRPPRRVTYGPNSTDEMADLVVQLVPRDHDDLAALKRDIRWKHYAQETAGDAHRAFRAARAAHAAGQLEHAVRGYRESLQLKFDEPLVHSSLADALASLGAWQDAVAHLEQALRLATAAGDDTLARSARERLDRYRRKGTP